MEVWKVEKRNSDIQVTSMEVEITKDGGQEKGSYNHFFLLSTSKTFKKDVHLLGINMTAQEPHARSSPSLWPPALIKHCYGDGVDTGEGGDAWA